MDSTRLKPGKDQRLPVSANAALVEAYRGAPTLMAGEAAGCQGKVRVWSPDRSLLRKQAWISVFKLALFGSVIALAGVSSHRVPFPAFGLLPSFLSIAAISLIGLYRPSYITTDEAGIGITRWRGSRALRWSDIQSMEKQVTYAPIWPKSRHVRLRVKVPQSLWISLEGYPESNQDELLTLIMNKAELQPNPDNRHLFSRTVELHTGKITPALPLA